MHRPSLFRRLVSGALVASSMVLSPFGMPQARASSPIVIGEVAWAGSSLSTADEWLELWNLGGNDVPIGGYILLGASTNPLSLPPDAVIPAHGTYLISNYDASNTKSVLAAAPQYVTTDVALSNSVLQVVLQDAAGTEVDRAGTGGAPPAGQSGSIKISMIRSGDVWINATTSVGFDEGSLDLGTPGVCDGCVVADPVPELPPPPEIIVEQTSSTTSETVVDTTPSSTSDTTTTEVATSTEPAPLATTDVVTSTETILSEETIATSTEPFVEIVAETSSTVTTDVVETAEAPRYDLLRLNEIEPNPMEGPEWVEITSIEPAIPVSLSGIQLFDAVGHVLTVTTGTVDVQTPFAHVALSSSRLNNGGDTVTIKDPSNGTLDSFTYGDTANGVAWARSPDATGEWYKTTTLTPDAANVVPEPPPTTPVATVTATPVEIASTTVPVSTTSASSVTTQASAIAPTTSVVTTPKPTPSPIKAKPVPAKAKPAQAPSPTPKPSTTVTMTAKNVAKLSAKPKQLGVKKPKTTATTKTNTYIPLTFDMINSEIDRGIRVSLQGVVGSPSGLLTSHGFILLSPDGRGLLVHVPTARKLPALGETLVVSGTLQFDDASVPSIKLNAGDGWTPAKTAISSVTPRDADLFTPSAEDAWSLVSVSGTILVIKNTTVTVMSDGADVDIAIRKVVGYRTSRLSVGDTINVTGLLNTSTDVPRVFPRTTDDIVLVSHAIKKQANASPTLPGWTPFGAAGIAVAGTEGVKHWRERRKRRTLEKILEKDLNATV